VACLTYSLQMTNNTTAQNPLDKFFVFSPLSLFEWATFHTVFPALVFLYLVVLFVVYANKSGHFSNAYFVFLFNHGLCDMYLALFTVYSIILDTAQKFLFGSVFDNFMAFLFFICYYSTQILPQPVHPPNQERLNELSIFLIHGTNGQTTQHVLMHTNLNSNRTNG